MKESNSGNKRSQPTCEWSPCQEWDLSSLCQQANPSLAMPSLDLRLQQQHWGHKSIAPPLCCMILMHNSFVQIQLESEEKSCILLVDPNHGALHGFPVQLSVVVNLHRPEDLKINPILAVLLHLAASALLIKVTSACPGFTIFARLRAPMSPKSSRMSS